MGHLRYLQGNFEEAKQCYERTLSFISDAREMHAIYLRLASIYLQDGQVRACYIQDFGLFLFLNPAGNKANCFDMDKHLIAKWWFFNILGNEDMICLAQR